MNNFAIQSFRTFVDGAFKPATVLVEDGKISAILDVEASPSTAEFYSLGDKMLIPGLTDTHVHINEPGSCLLYTSPSPRDVEESRMPSSA